MVVLKTTTCLYTALGVLHVDTPLPCFAGLMCFWSFVHIYVQCKQLICALHTICVYAKNNDGINLQIHFYITGLAVIWRWKEVDGLSFSIKWTAP